MVRRAAVLAVLLTLGACAVPAERESDAVLYYKARSAAHAYQTCLFDMAVRGGDALGILRSCRGERLRALAAFNRALDGDRQQASRLVATIDSKAFETIAAARIAVLARRLS